MNNYFQDKMGPARMPINQNDLQQGQQPDPTDPPPQNPRLPYPPEATTNSLKWKWYNLQESGSADPMDWEADEELVFNWLKRAEREGGAVLDNYMDGNEGTDSYILNKQRYRVAMKNKDKFDPEFFEQLMSNYKRSPLQERVGRDASRLGRHLSKFRSQ